MPKSLTQYRIFIGSPSGLQEERERFLRFRWDKYTRLHGEPRGITFHPVGWEDIDRLALADRKPSSMKT